MAYLDIPQEEEQQQPGQATGAAGGTAVTGGPTQVAPDRSSGRWTNLQDYLKLNRPQAQQMAGNIAGDVAQQRQQYGQNVQEAGQQYQDYLGGLQKAEEDKRAWTEKVAGGFTPATEEIQQRAQEGQFQQSAAPRQMELGGLQAQQRALQQRTGALGTEQGRLAELQKIQGQQATRGEGLLNQLLLQGSQAGRAALGEQRQLGTGGALAPARQQALQQMQQAAAQQAYSVDPARYQAITQEMSGIPAAMREAQEQLHGKAYGEWLDMTRSGYTQDQATDWVNQNYGLGWRTGAGLEGTPGVGDTMSGVDEQMQNRLRALSEIMGASGQEFTPADMSAFEGGIDPWSMWKKHIQGQPTTAQYDPLQGFNPNDPASLWGGSTQFQPVGV
jgi:hypothetical protein